VGRPRPQHSRLPPATTERSVVTIEDRRILGQSDRPTAEIKIIIPNGPWLTSPVTTTSSVAYVTRSAINTGPGDQRFSPEMS
jgi:hypothetical protein